MTGDTPRNGRRHATECQVEGSIRTSAVLALKGAKSPSPNTADMCVRVCLFSRRLAFPTCVPRAVLSALLPIKRGSTTKHRSRGNAQVLVLVLVCACAFVRVLVWVLLLVRVCFLLLLCLFFLSLCLHAKKKAKERATRNGR